MGDARMPGMWPIRQDDDPPMSLLWVTEREYQMLMAIRRRKFNEIFERFAERVAEQCDAAD